MTEIRSIHGLGELAQRGNLFTTQPAYIPYLSMTRGEMRLALLQQQAQVYAAAYPENPEYSRAVSMIDNALNSGVSRGVSFVGAIDGRYLQAVAAEISRASRQRSPAAKIGILGRDSIGQGINIDKSGIPVADRLAACLQRAKTLQQKTDCYKAAKIEEILNAGLIKCGHHILYKNLRSSDNLNALVTNKMQNHKTGVEGLAVVGNIDAGLMYDWVETVILQKNTTGNVGPIGSRETSFILGNREAIGDPATIIAIATLISAALGGAVSLLKQMQSEKAYAMAEARSFGTPSNSASTEDWLGSPVSSDNSFLLIGGAALAAYLLTQK